MTVSNGNTDRTNGTPASAAFVNDIVRRMKANMRRVRFSIAMGLDGFIAGPNGEFDWIVINPGFNFGALWEGFGTVLLVRKSDDATKRQGTAGMQEYVFPRRLRQSDCTGVIVSDKPAETIAALKETMGEGIWLFGGGSLFKSFLEMGIVNAVELAVISLLLGGGIPLPSHPARQMNLRLVKYRV